jgi:hypothetical protein
MMPRLAHGSVATLLRLQDAQRDLAGRTADIELGVAVAGPAALQVFDRLVLEFPADQTNLPRSGDPWDARSLAGPCRTRSQEGGDA